MRSLILVALVISYVFSSTKCSHCQASSSSSNSDHVLRIAKQTSFQKLNYGQNTVWEAKADIMNMSNFTEKVSVKEITNKSNGYQISYCWDGICKENDNNSQLLSSVIPAQQRNSSFRVYAKPTIGNNSPAKIAYRFWGANLLDSVDVEFVIIPQSTTVQNIPLAKGSITNNTLSIFPNPASVQTTIDFTFNIANFQKAYLKIYDLMGKEINQYDIDSNEGSLKLNLRSFNDGVYFCSLVVNDKSVITKRFVVAK